jgi:Fe-S-cluster containining protein
MNPYILRELHSTLRQYDNICPRSCCLCEHYETAILIQNEDQLISRNPELINYFIKHQEGFYYLDMDTECPYLSLKNEQGECLIYNERPVDCRIFPFYPKFNLEDNSYILLRSKFYCPLSTNALLIMEQDVKKVLDVVNVSVSKPWKQLYNRLNYQRVKSLSTCKSLCHASLS